MKTFNSILILALVALSFGFAERPLQPQKNYVLKENARSIPNGPMFSRFEVSNTEFKEFLMGLIEEGRAEDVPVFAPKMELWENVPFTSPYNKYYFSHSAFDNYPVVGVSHAAAEAFCEWKSRKYGENVVSKGKKPVGKYRFRLPTEKEWMEAANPNRQNPAYLAGGYAYPRDSKGRFLFNHKLGKGDYAGTIEGDSKDFEGYMITAPVRSFFPDDFGLYNLPGNVAEMVAEAGVSKGGSWFHEAEHCRIEAKLSYEDAEVWLGFRYVVERIK